MSDAAAIAALRRGRRFETAGALRSAERAYRQALVLLRGHAAPQRALARALHRLGSVLQQQGRYRAAARVLRRAVDVTERAHGPHSVALVGPLNELGMCFKYLARFSDAGPLYQRALAIVERRFGALLLKQRRLGEAEDACRRAIQIFSRALGPRHPNLAVLRHQRRFADSRRWAPGALRVLHLRTSVLAPANLAP